MGYNPYVGNMAKTKFDDFWRELEAEAKAEGPSALDQLRLMQHRFRIGGQISVLRNRQGLTQKELGDKVGIDQAEISRIERGVANPTEDTLAAIARALGVELGLVSGNRLVAA